MHLFHLKTRFSFLAAAVFLSGLVFSASPLFAGTYRVVLDECKKRTGLGESVCKSLVKNNLTVQSCMERAGLSEKECSKRVEEIKNDPEYTGVKQGEAPQTPSQTPSATPGRTLALPQTTTQYNDLIGRIRSKKENSLIDLEKRTESILAFLRTRGVDTAPIEASFPELEKKVTTLLGAYDTFRVAYIGTVKDTESVKAAVREDARVAVRVAANDLVDFYQTKILTPIRVARDQIK
ncbi:MAG: hypothetical protein ACEQSB_01815 [Undibacterium sp.]